MRVSRWSRDQFAVASQAKADEQSAVLPQVYSREQIILFCSMSLCPVKTLRTQGIKQTADLGAGVTNALGGKEHPEENSFIHFSGGRGPVYHRARTEGRGQFA